MTTLRVSSCGYSLTSLHAVMLTFPSATTYGHRFLAAADDVQMELAEELTRRESSLTSGS